MDTAEFEIWLSAIGGLNAEQRGHASRVLALAEADDPADDGTLLAQAESGATRAAALPDALDGAPEESLAARIGRVRNESFGCPHCGLREIRPWGRAGGRPRYRCVACRKTFNPLTGTPLSRLHYQDRWREQARALIDGDTLSKAAERCDIDRTTAFRWRHRFLAALTLDKPRRLSGIVEADETFMLESFKGRRRNLPRPARRRGGRATQRGLSKEQIPVIVARDRSGATFDAVLPGLDAASMTAALGDVIARGSDFCCDAGAGIGAFARRAGLKLHVLPAPGGPKPDAPQFHINNVNAYHGRLKEWMRRFHGVATDNLPNYLSWRRTIEALEDKLTPEALIMGAAGLGPYQQRSQ
jgi:transposase-like protein